MCTQRQLAASEPLFSALFDGSSDTVQFDGQASFMEGVKKLVDLVPIPQGQPLEPAAEDGSSELPGEAALSVDVEAEAVTTEGPHTPAVARGLSVVRLADGGLRIDAPPELAAPLAALLESLAQALRAPQLSAAAPSALAAQ